MAKKSKAKAPKVSAKTKETLAENTKKPFSELDLDYSSAKLTTNQSSDGKTLTFSITNNETGATEIRREPKEVLPEELLEVLEG
jgi:hypothetical protein